METLKITAKMMEPIVYKGDGLHIDGPLAYACFCDLPSEEKNNVPLITEPWAIDFEIPLSKWLCKPPKDEYLEPKLLNEDGLLWGWCASAVYADWKCESAYAVRRKTETEKMSKYTTSPSVSLGAGAQKAVDMKYPERWANVLHWYVIGDLKEVERLLKTYILAIGKLHNKGPGRVLEWKIEKVNKELSFDNQLLRIMPAVKPWKKDNVMLARAGIRPPYHHRSRRVLSVIPDYEEFTNVQ